MSNQNATLQEIETAKEDLLATIHKHKYLKKYNAFLTKFILQGKGTDELLDHAAMKFLEWE